MIPSIKLLPYLAGISLLVATPAFAQLTYTVTNINLVAAPGNDATFTGMITNQTGSDLTASEIFFQFSAFNPSVVTPIQLIGTPDFSLPNFTYSPTVDLFSIALSPTATIGTTYSTDAFITDINGDTGNDIVVTVKAASPTSADEPDCVPLLVTALGVALLRTWSGRSNPKGSLAA
jgi:hypothetical protein